MENHSILSCWPLWKLLFVRKARHSSASCVDTQVRWWVFIPETQMPSYPCKVWSTAFTVRARFLPLDCDHGTESALAQYCRQWVMVTSLTAFGLPTPNDNKRDDCSPRAWFLTCFWSGKSLWLVHKELCWGQEERKLAFLNYVTFFPRLQFFYYLLRRMFPSIKCQLVSVSSVMLTFLPLISTCLHMFPQQPFLHKPQFVLVSMQANRKWLIAAIWVKGGNVCALWWSAGRNPEKELSDTVRISSIMGNESWRQLSH